MSRQVKDANGVWHTVAGGDALTFTGTLEEWNALTPAQQNTYSRKYITNDTTLTSDLMTGATASTNGTQGLVPAPLAGDQDKVLKGNGSWSTLPIGDMANLTTTEKNTLVGAVNEVKSQADKCECLVVSANSVSALPVDISNANIETDMVVVQSVLSNPSAQIADWTWSTDTAGKVRISGTNAISGTTNITLYLMKSR